MVDLSTLQGYLMKEKSKTGLLHGLTGEINKRYFKVQKIEGSDELALCYYRNISDPEVRSWIYLKDMIEIAEDKDTMIFSSAARTLHLYAETRAEHNLWVTSLAELCPDAFVKLERNAPMLKKKIDKQAMPKEKVDKQALPTGTLLDTAEKASCSPGKARDDDQAYLGSKAGSLSDPSRGALNDDDDTLAVELVGDNCSSRSTSEDVRKRLSGFEQERHRRRRPKESWVRHRNREQHDSEESDDSSGSKCGPHRQEIPTVEGRTVDGADEPNIEQNRENRSPNGDAPVKVSLNSSGGQDSLSCKIRPRPNRIIGVRKSDDLHERRFSRRKGETSRASEAEGGARMHSFLTAGRNRSSRYSCSDSEQDLDINHEEFRKNIDQNLSPAESIQHLLRRTPEDQALHDEESTIDLHKVSNEVCRRGGTDGGDPTSSVEAIEAALVNEYQVSNQGEEREFAEQAEIVMSTPLLELTEGEPRQGKSITSRLHRHIPHIDGAGGEVDGYEIPAPKEFLANQSDRSRRIARRDHEENPQAKETGRCVVATSLKRGRRRSAADLEWSGGEAPREYRPGAVELKLAAPVYCGSVDVSDSDDAVGNLNLDIKNQRRRACAAIQALEAAAKEADEGCVERSRSLGGGLERGEAKHCYSSNGNDTVPRKGRKTTGITAPAGSPPPGSSGKIRRGRGQPPPGMAPPQTAPPTRVKPANHRTDPDENFVNDDWDNDVKAEADGHVSPKSAEEAGNRARRDKEAPLNSSR